MKNANNNTLKDKQADIDVKILIAGDTGPTKSNMELFKRGNGEALFGSELIKLFNNHNYSIINLECDYLIVLYHGGVQEYRFPTPKLSIICKRMCDKGADLVICQHSHCIGCEEDYNNAKIIYGQGNFLLDSTEIEEWKTGLLLSIIVDNEMGLKIVYHPIAKSGNVVRITTEEEKNLIMKGYYKKTVQIQEKGFIEKKFDEYCSSKEADYFMACFGMKSIMRRIINRTTKGFLLKKWYGRRERLKVFNYITCEDHHEILQRIMGKGV